MRLAQKILALSSAFALTLLTADTPKYPDKLAELEKAGDFMPMFPFLIEHGQPNNITNVNTWAQRPVPAGKDGPIVAKDGVFVDQAHGVANPKRFLGTNICFSGCFPTHEEADKVAAALARFGINAVRLHYVHHVMPKNGAYPNKDSFLEPVQLERFDYLYAQLRKHGIYTYMQLNIGRRFGKHNGFQNADKLPWYNNGIDCFEPKMIQLHKNFCTEFLNHVNPYTQLAYKDDPAIANLEIANENSIVNAWFSSKYTFHQLTEPYATLLRDLWNDFLGKKYDHDLNKLLVAWKGTQQAPGAPTELMPEGILNTDVQNAPETLWGLQQDGVSDADWTLLPATPADQLKGKFFARINVRKTGATPNMPQFYRTDFKFTKGAFYTFSFSIRAAKPTSVALRFSQHHEPWRRVGLSTTLQVTPDWQRFTFPLRSNLDDERVRFVFANFIPGSTVDIADVSFKTGADMPDNIASDFAAKRLSCPSPAEWTLVEQRARDFTEFLYQLEHNYFSQLYRHIKDTIRPLQPVTGTQLHYGLDHAQAFTDYCDNHSYWCHPAFPGKAWSSHDWYVVSKAAVNTDQPGSTLTSLARARILGKPYTVSEYDHPNTNLYAAEGNLMLAATAAFQNWGGIYQFAWSHSRDFERQLLSGMFDMCSMTTKLAHLPACYAMFVRGDVQTAARQTIFAIPSSLQEQIRHVAERRTAHTLHSFYDDPVARTLPLALYAGVTLPEMPHLFQAQGQNIVTSSQQLPEAIRKMFQEKRVQNDTGQLVWDFSRPQKGLFTVNTPLTKVITGFPDDRDIVLDGLTLRQGPSRLGWLTFSLVNTTPPNAKASTQSSSHLLPGDYLLAVTGLSHNSNAIYADLGNNRLAPAKASGGRIGTAPVLCEGIDATITLHGLTAAQLTCHALDAKGEKTQQLAIKNTSKGAQLSLSPTYKTVWYQLTVKP